VRRPAVPRDGQHLARVNRHYGKADSGTWIEAGGVVRRLLADDDEAEHHQRVIVDLRNGQTLLIAHNIDIAQRVPLGLGDRIRFRGLYEWNDLGGLVHWTHGDPLGVVQGGYLRYRGRDYR